MAYSKRDQDGGASVRDLASRDAEATAARRAKAAARKSRSKSHNGNVTTDIFSEMRQDRADERARRAQEAEAKQFAFRVSQANLAKDSAAITSLHEGSVAHIVALLIIEEFPAADPVTDGNNRIGRLKMASTRAQLRMEAKDIARSGAIRCGEAAARTALNGAFNKLAD